MNRLLSIVLLGASLLAVVGQWHRAERRLESSGLVWAVKQRGQAVTAGQAPGRILAGAIPMVQEARALDPVSIEAAAASADLYFLLGRDATAREAYLEALALEARPELYLNLGILELRRGELEVGRELLEMVQRLDRRLVPPAREALRKYGASPAAGAGQPPSRRPDPSTPSDAAGGQHGPNGSDEDR